jgi:hypothetical protein
MTNKFTFSNEFVDYHGKVSTLDMEFSADNLSDVLDHFERFLTGCGFVLDGHLSVVNEDGEFDEDEMNSYLDDLESEERHDSYYHATAGDEGSGGLYRNMHSDK